MRGTQLCASEGNGMLDNPQLGGFVTRDHPGKGMRPTVRFVLARPADGWLGRLRHLGRPSRGGTISKQAIGPVAAWLIPVLLAYIPGLVIGFMACHADRQPATTCPRLTHRAALARRASGRRSPLIAAA